MTNPVGRAFALAAWGAGSGVVWVVYARWLMQRVGGTPLDFAVAGALAALLQGFVLTRLKPNRQLLVACAVGCAGLAANRVPALEAFNPAWIGMLALAAVIANIFGRGRVWWWRALVAGAALDLGLVVMVVAGRGAAGTAFDGAFLRVLLALAPLGLAVATPLAPYPADAGSAAP